MSHNHAVIFDIDGVLLHLTRQEEKKFFDAFRATFGIAEHHINPDWNSYKVRNDVAIASELLERHFGRRAEHVEIRAVLDHYTSTIVDGLASGDLVTRMIEGASSLLDGLRRSGTLHLGLATANLRGAAEARLQHAGLWGTFSACGYAESGGPKVEILRAAIDQLRDAGDAPLRPDRIVFLGDQLSDLAAACENQVHFIGVSARAEQRALLRDNGADPVVGNHADTAAVIARVLGLQAL